MPAPIDPDRPARYVARPPAPGAAVPGNGHRPPEKHRGPVTLRRGQVQDGIATRERSPATLDMQQIPGNEFNVGAASSGSSASETDDSGLSGGHASE